MGNLVDMNLMKRSILYFFASFLNAGLQNIVPQVFFSEKYPQHQAFLLSICLLTGAAASLFTIFAQPKSKEQHSRFRWSVWIQVLLIAVLLVSLWFWKTAVLYILSFLFLRALIQIVYNRMDHHYVSMTKKQAMGSYARFATLFQLVGIMLGPLYFSVVYAHVSLNIAVLAVLALLLLWSFKGAFALPTRSKVTESAECRTDESSNSSSVGAEAAAANEIVSPSVTQAQFHKRQTVFFILYLLAATTGVHIFSNNIIMIVRSVYQVQSPVIKSGILLMLMNASGIAAVALLPFLRGKLKAGFFQSADWMKGHTAYALLFLLCVVLLRWPFAFTYSYLIVLSVATGAVYGLFWTKSREYAVRGLAGQTSKWTLTMYNNANNFSILFSAIVLFLSSVVSAKAGGTYPGVIMITLLGFFAISTVFAVSLDFRTIINRRG